MKVVVGGFNACNLIVRDIEITTSNTSNTCSTGSGVGGGAMIDLREQSLPIIAFFTRIVSYTGGTTFSFFITVKPVDMNSVYTNESVSFGLAPFDYRA